MREIPSRRARPPLSTVYPTLTPRPYPPKLANMPRRLPRNLILALLLLAPMACAKTPGQLRYESFLAMNAPAETALGAAPQGYIQVEPTLHVRVYADDTYRGKTPLWMVAARRRMDTFAAYVRVRFHVKVEVDAVTPWQHAVAATGSPGQDAAAFVHDVPPAAGIWTVVFVGPYAESCGHAWDAEPARGRVYVRTAVSAAEWRNADALQGITKSDMPELIHDRLRHRELMVLLRAWATSLAVPTDAEWGHVMAPLYDLHASEFSPASARLVQLGLAHFTDTSAEGKQAWTDAAQAAIRQQPDAFAPHAADDVARWIAGGGGHMCGLDDASDLPAPGAPDTHPSGASAFPAETEPTAPR